MLNAEFRISSTYISPTRTFESAEGREYPTNIPLRRRKPAARGV